MDNPDLISEIKNKYPQLSAVFPAREYADEVCLPVQKLIFKDACLVLHRILSSPVAMLFAVDERVGEGKFVIHCVFCDVKRSQWVTVSTDIAADDPSFDSLSKSIYSASLFEREIWEMFGIKPQGNPDLRRLHLHDEVWPADSYPLRKDFQKPQGRPTGGEYKFGKVEGEGIFEVPVGPVHAGIIGPGHFRFSCAGEPIINLELRLGFTHRGVEKLFEGKTFAEALRIAERVSGDSVVAHSLAFTHAVEKICAVPFCEQTACTRAVFLELERMYNHANDIGGIAVDVGFSFPAALASIIKEAILQLNEELAQSRYLKGANAVAGVLVDIDENKKIRLRDSLKKITKDFRELVKILNSSVSFMDRVDTAGVLRRKTAEDLGVVGLAARASGIPLDLRKNFPGVYHDIKFKMALEQSGDVLARLKVRISEFEESARLIELFLSRISGGQKAQSQLLAKAGAALGYAEGWRGPVLYWVKADAGGVIERCKVVDASFHNWPGLSYAVLGNIIPDFPLCNKSFDLSYSGNDL